MKNDNAIEIRHLTKEYRSFCLEDINLMVPKGTILGLIGENGAGKSTTIKCILNLVRCNGGEIQVLGLDHRAQEREVKARTAVVFDECPFHETLTPAMVGKVLSGACPDWDEARYEALLREFELPGDKIVKEFSRGMKMKLSIAAALARNPQVLLLDEATSGLDPVVRDSILEKLMDFVQPHHQRFGKGGGLCGLPPQGKTPPSGGEGRTAGGFWPPGLYPCGTGRGGFGLFGGGTQEPIPV